MSNDGRETRVRATARWLAVLPGVLMLAGCVAAVPSGPAVSVAPGYGATCSAGVYVCPLPQQSRLGTQCSCPGLGAPSFGTVR